MADGFVHTAHKGWGRGEHGRGAAMTSTIGPRRVVRSRFCSVCDQADLTARLERQTTGIFDVVDLLTSTISGPVTNECFGDDTRRARPR